jgi:hypothetical protein
MTIPMTQSGVPSRRVARSVGAVAAGFFAVAVLSLLTDQLFHSLAVYPPWGQPMWEPGLNLLALGYRVVYTVLGGYIAARLAPRSPVRHAIWLGVVGTVAGALGAYVAITQQDLGPNWYPIALALRDCPAHGSVVSYTRPAIGA